MSVASTPESEDVSDQQEKPLDISRRKAQLAWERLRMHILSITPAGLMRFLIVASALIGLLWLIISAFQSLIPLAIGMLLAYITLPLVNRLDSVMPRGLAVLLVVLGELALIVLFFILLIPIVIQEVNNFLGFLPSQEEVSTFLNQFAQQVHGLPEPVQTFLRGWLKDTLGGVRQHLITYVQGFLHFSFNGLLSLLTSFGFVLSLLVIPTWLFSVLNNQHRGARALNQLLPAWLRPDFWAVVRIVDRTFSIYLRELVIMGALVGIATYGGLALLGRLGVPGIQSPLLLAMIAGFGDLIPTIGPVLAAIPAVLLGFLASWKAGIVILIFYIAIRIVRNLLLAPLFSGKSITIPPALLVVILIIASQFGLVWLFFAAPLAVVIRDLYRYIYGRFDDPPKPAGVLPGESTPQSAPMQYVSPSAQSAVRVFPYRSS